MAQGFINLVPPTFPVSVLNGGTGVVASRGTGSVVLSTSPTLTTPLLQVDVGTGTPGAGEVGQFISSAISSGSKFNVVSGTITNITSISLTAGCWLIFGSGAIQNNPDAQTSLEVWSSTTSATRPDASKINKIVYISGNIQTIGSFSIPNQVVNISTTTTVYLSMVSTNAGTAATMGIITGLRIV